MEYKLEQVKEICEAMSLDGAEFAVILIIFIFVYIGFMLWLFNRNGELANYEC